MVIDKGIRQHGLDKDGKMMKDLAPVDWPEQMVAYCKIFYLTDKRNGMELRYTMANCGSKTHGGTPKLSFWLFNMTLNNAYKIYNCLFKRHHRQYQNVDHWLKPLTIDQAVEAVYWLFLQKEDTVWTWKAAHPPPTRHLQFVMNTNGGNKIQTNIDGTYNTPVTPKHYEITASTIEKNSLYQGKRMNEKEKSYLWYTHQPECQEERPGEWSYEDYPDWQQVFYQKGVQRAPWAPNTRYKYLECSIDDKTDTYFVIIFQNVTLVFCNVICYITKSICVPTRQQLTPLMMTRMTTTNTI